MADSWSPVVFYEVVNVLRDAEASLAQVSGVVAEVDVVATKVDAVARSLGRTRDAMREEVVGSTRRRSAFASKSDEDAWSEDVLSSGDGSHFLPVVFDVVRRLALVVRLLRDAASDVVPPVLTLPPGRLGLSASKLTFDVIQRVDFEVRLNGGAVTRFVDGVDRSADARRTVVDAGRDIARMLDAYHRVLVRRHGVDGVKIFRDPVSTDVALAVFENVDADGEVDGGKRPDEVSVRTLRKAEVLVDAVMSGTIGEFVRDPEVLIGVVRDFMEASWRIAGVLETLARPVDADLRRVRGLPMRRSETFSAVDFADGMAALSTLDPRGVEYREQVRVMSREERFGLDFRNETIEGVVERIATEGSAPADVVNYVLGRKQRLRDYFRDENSFYVCRIGAGNPFTGVAPGALEVVPSERPNVDLGWVLGSGFDEIRGFLADVGSSARFHDLFVATSPSGTADKANVLLVGPPGCGKSEVLRAVGGDKGSVGIFAQGSDFMTCWKGEAEKNPKRMFEAALRLRKESGKRVYLLLDEADAVLHKNVRNESFGDANLTTEFQILMDGIVHYPGVAVWGATNFPERIPMAMIRRFGRVMIVGELSQDDRTKLLRHFVGGYLPEKVSDGAWHEQALRLAGATGDVVRKVADRVWRSKMSGFVRSRPAEAEAVAKTLSDGKTSFSAATFTGGRRSDFLARLSSYVCVGDVDVAEAVDACLADVAVRHEIRTAVETYARAREFLAPVLSA